MLDNQELGEGPGTDPSLVPSEGTCLCQHHDFRILDSRAVKKINPCCPKLPGLLCFIMHSQPDAVLLQTLPLLATFW